MDGGEAEHKFSDWILPESLRCEWTPEITNQEEEMCFFHHGSSSFLKLKMINQCCIEFFTTSKKAYQAAVLSKKLAVTHTLRACDKNQQHPAWMMVKWLAVRTFIWSLEGSGKMNEAHFIMNVLIFIAASTCLDHLMMQVYLRLWYQTSENVLEIQSDVFLLFMFQSFQNLSGYWQIAKLKKKIIVWHFMLY